MVMQRMTGRRLGVLSLLVWLSCLGCSGAAQYVRSACDSPDDSECPNEKLKQPDNADLKTGRTAHGESLAEVIRTLRARTPSLPKAVTLLIDKSDRTLTVKLGDVEVRTYGVSLGFDPIGDKVKSGDGRTPEGEFYVGYTAPPRGTRYYRSIHIPHPSIERAGIGLAEGLISQKEFDHITRAHKRCGIPPQKTKLGGYVLIHGGGGGAGYSDWTLGCVALTDSEIREVHSVVEPGCENGQPRTRLIIRP